MKKLLSTVVMSAAALAVSGTMAAAAPDIPCETAKLIVPWKAGGGSTLFLIMIYQRMYL